MAYIKFDNFFKLLDVSEIKQVVYDSPVPGFASQYHFDVVTQVLYKTKHPTFVIFFLLWCWGLNSGPLTHCTAYLHPKPDASF